LLLTFFGAVAAEQLGLLVDAIDALFAASAAVVVEVVWAEGLALLDLTSLDLVVLAAAHLLRRLPLARIICRPADATLFTIATTNSRLSVIALFTVDVSLRGSLLG